MNVRLAYGQTGLDVELPAERTTVVRPTPHEGARDERAALRAALDAPVSGPRLRELARPGQRVAISMCDGTRAQPRELMIPVVLDELAGIIPDADVVILVATGTHRGNTEQELRAMLGDELYERVEVVNHDARDPDSLVSLGVHGNGVPVAINRRWVQADLRITTGFVEPHFFAGFSGGPKLIAPGLAGLDTVLVLHDAARIGDPRATWGVIYGNPVHDDVRAAASAAPATFSLRRDPQQRAAHHHRVRRRDRSDARRRMRRGATLRDADRRGSVRRRGHEQLGIPAGPEPLPGRQGHVRGGEDRQGRWHDRLRRGVPGRLPRPRTLPRAARIALQPGRADRVDHDLAAHDPRPMAGAGAGEHPVARDGRHLYTDHPHRRGGARGAPGAHARHRGDRAATRSTAPGPAATVCVLPEGPQTIPILASEPTEPGRPKAAFTRDRGGGGEGAFTPSRVEHHRGPEQQAVHAERDQVVVPEVAQEVVDGDDGRDRGHDCRDHRGAAHAVVAERTGQIADLEEAGREDDRRREQERELRGMLVVEAAQQPAGHAHAVTADPGDQRRRLDHAEAGGLP